VAERIERYAGIVGRERVIAGVDCGFGTGSSIRPGVDPALALAKLKALSEGAEIASRRLW
jgi:5-methyltetrahydropteroyltriglutamate--homocysteine methyltransferase